MVEKPAKALTGLRDTSTYPRLIEFEKISE
jgi:hypothetical protein